MSRADACDPFLHGHRPRCARQGYANGRADLADAVEALLAYWEERAAHFEPTYGEQVISVAHIVRRVRGAMADGLDK